MSARAVKVVAAVAMSALVLVAVTLTLRLPGADPRPPQLGDPVVICPAPPGTPDAGPAMRIPVRARHEVQRCLGAGRLAEAWKSTTQANKEEA
jgi:hypothetical protein